MLKELLEIKKEMEPVIHEAFVKLQEISEMLKLISIL